jgi:photosystem II stability/assembly factor-like uncharacterized protein
MNPDFDLEPLLRGRGADHLMPPTGTWESIARRARRRKTAKALLAAGALVVVAAGATPAILAVRHSGNNQRLSLDAGQHKPVTNSPIDVTPTLQRLVPTSVTFVSQQQGWASGVLEVPGGTVAGGLGKTTDAGVSWTIELPRPAPQGTVRFANADEGFSFGSTYQVTRDGGRHWQTVPSPGYIADLETDHGAVWALVRSCVRCEGLRLFTATLADPALTRVAAVPPIGHDDAALTLQGRAVYVTGGNDFWETTDLGTTWRQETNPCGGGSQAFSAWSETGIAAECTPVRGMGSLFESLDAGRDWTNVANVPHVRAGVGTLSAGTPNDLLLTTGVGAPYVSHVHGNHWVRAPVDGAVIFAAFISNSHVVGLTGGRDPAFVFSDDFGRTWMETFFHH